MVWGLASCGGSDPDLTDAASIDSGANDIDSGPDDADAGSNNTPLAVGVESSEVQWAAYLDSGGSSQWLREIAFDSSGNVVVVGMGGYHGSSFGAVTPTEFGNTDLASDPASSNIVVAKIRGDGSQLLWATLLGGYGTNPGARSGLEKGGYGLALNSSDEVFITGTTHSSDFPTTPGAWDETANGVVEGDHPDAFVAKLSADGSDLLYSSFLGGARAETARGGLEIDGQDNVYVVGATRFSANDDYLNEGNVSNPAHVNPRTPDPGNIGDGFITKVSGDGSSILYNRFIGSPNNANNIMNVMGARIDPSGRLHFVGHDFNDGAIVTDGSVYHGGMEIYWGVLSEDGRDLQQAGYIGGSSTDVVAKRPWLDEFGNFYIVGSTTSDDFPTENAAQPIHGGGADGYLIKLDAAGEIALSTYVGGSGNDDAWGPAVDQYGNMYVVGRSYSLDFATTPDAIDSTGDTNGDCFLRIYNANGDLLYSTLFGGSGADQARFVALAPNGDVVIVVYTDSSDFAPAATALQTTFNGPTQAYLLRMRFVFETQAP